jgi:hypothetical protein
MRDFDAAPPQKFANVFRERFCCQLPRPPVSLR